jgi:hypothetical protein
MTLHFFNDIANKAHNRKLAVHPETAKPISEEEPPQPERFSLKKGAPSGALEVIKPKQVPEPRREADQTVRLPIDTKSTTSSIRIGFTQIRT